MFIKKIEAGSISFCKSIKVALRVDGSIKWLKRTVSFASDWMQVAGIIFSELDTVTIIVERDAPEQNAELNVI